MLKEENDAFDSFFESLCSQFGRSGTNDDGVPTPPNVEPPFTPDLSLISISVAVVVFSAWTKTVNKVSKARVARSALRSNMTMLEIRALIRNHLHILGHIKTAGAGRSKSRILEEIRHQVHAKCSFIL